MTASSIISTSDLNAALMDQLPDQEVDDVATEISPQKTSRKKSTASVKRPRAETNHRIHHQPAFVLHAWPYKETSLILDVFTREHGRLQMVAKGAKRPHSQLRSVLQTFQPLNVSWTGKSEVKTLMQAEWVAGMLPLEKAALLYGFYLNELLQKFLLREEIQTHLFDYYVQTLNRLAHGEAAAIALRQFELRLLQSAGVLGELHRDVECRQIVDELQLYVVDPERGTRRALAHENWPKVLGKTLLAMQREDYQDPVTQFESKLVMRALLQHHLHGAHLNTRQILLDLQKI